uniref:Tachykinin-related peptide 8 n=2 Tax=Reduviidae TaxID=27479 RepID=TRP8_RHOPR|nr:RecName: Full=Tachykinin-related peptide 8; Short=Rhopr-TRP-8; Contains: RecName: Full=Tachykinin-related peptide 8(8-12); Short=Rhopr-TRP-8(8-12) [Rhodnius prolixus]
QERRAMGFVGMR